MMNTEMPADIFRISTYLKSDFFLKKKEKKQSVVRVCSDALNNEFQGF